MNKFFIAPRIKLCAGAAEFCDGYGIGKEDLVFISGGMYRRSFAGRFADATVIDYRKYGAGEPTDTMVESICRDILGQSFRRIFAIGGGTVLDVAKLFALSKCTPVSRLFAGEIIPEKDKKLFLIPTTCGTGSEVTNISILEMTALKTKMGLSHDALYADEAILIPELLQDLPHRFFAASSMDALIHAVESYTSPKATEFTQMFSAAAVKKIISGYKKIAGGQRPTLPQLGDFLTASTCAGIAFSNAGCAAVHALSYPLGAARHVPHGEANYAVFIKVYKTYESIRRDGALASLKRLLAETLGCLPDEAFDKLEALLGQILRRKALREYGVREDEITDYADIAIKKQGRLMANNYVPLSRDIVLKIYQSLY